MPAPDTSWESIVDQAMQDCIDVFGEGADQVTIQHYNGAGYDAAYTVDGIFDAQSVQVDPDTGVQVISNEPMMSFKVSDLTQLLDNRDRIVIRGVTYTVKEPEFDGQGTCTVMLFRAT